MRAVFGSRKRPQPRRNGWLIGLGVLGSLIVADQLAGNLQEREIARRRELKAQLDKLTSEGLRTGIDEITFEDSRYHLKLRIQNASRKPFYLLVPTLEGYVQVGPGWEPFAIRPAEGEVSGGAVIKLDKERVISEIANIDVRGYAEHIPGYRHVKLTLEAFLSPEDNPQEEIGERREDYFIFLRDVTRDAEFGPVATGRPSFIPLRAWTLLPKEAL